MSLNKILSTTEYVVKHAKDVTIDYEKVDEFCKTFKEEKFNWTNLLPIDYSIFSKEELIKFLLIQDSVNFCFWGDPKWEYYYKGKTYSGSIAMVLALYEAISKDRSLFNDNRLINLNIDDIRRIFPLDNNNQYIPLIEERLNNLINIGLGFESIQKELNCTLTEIIDNMNDEEELFNFISKYFTSYSKDETLYNGKKVYLHKRIQLVISDINTVVYSDNKFTLNKLRIFPDYKIPQLMRALGFIIYSDKLSNIVDNKIEIKKDDDMETEIRASIVQVGHYIVNKLNERGIIVNDSYIDNYMFFTIKTNKDLITKPYHHVRTTNY